MPQNRRSENSKDYLVSVLALCRLQIRMNASSHRSVLRIRYVYLSNSFTAIAGKVEDFMSRKPQSKDEALEALDFIVNVLKEHEKDLDRLIGELGTVTEQIGASSDLAVKVEKIEEKVTGLQDEISSLVECLSKSSAAGKPPCLLREHSLPEPVQLTSTSQVQSNQALPIHNGPPVVLRCKQWEDFQNLASQAQTTSFLVKETEHTFQVDALKGNQIVTYYGELPKAPLLVKVWLSKQMGISEKSVLEGVLAIG